MRRVIVNPYPEFTRRLLRRLDAMSHDETIDLMKEVGILDKRGNLAKKYRTPPEELAASKPKPARTRTRKPSRRKRS